MDLKLQTLDYIFSGTKDYADEVHQPYVQPLLESGLTVEGSLAMLAINRLSESAIERAKAPTVTHTSLYRTSESSPALGKSKWF